MVAARRAASSCDRRSDLGPSVRYFRSTPQELTSSGCTLRSVPSVPTTEVGGDELKNGGHHSESPASRRPPNRFSMPSLRVNTGFCPRNTLPMKPGAKLSSTEIDERLQQKGSQPRLRDGTAFPVLQLRPHPPHTQGHARDGGWRDRSALGSRGYGSGA
jgi:hypothetical protein